MKKPLPNTKCTVKLRKSEYREDPSGTSTESLYAARIWIMKRAAMPTR